VPYILRFLPSVVLVCVGPCCGSARADDLAKLDVMARASQGEYKPIEEQDLQNLRGALRASAQDLQNALAARGVRFADDWNSYLQWSRLKPHLSTGGQIDHQELAGVGLVLGRLRANKPGLEGPVFTEMADALEHYRQVALWVAAARDEDPRSRYASLLASLANQLERHQEAATTETAWKIGRILFLITQLEQAPQLIRAIHDQWIQTNVMVEVSETFINRLAQSRPTNDSRPVRDCILGTSIRGRANTKGSLLVRLVPSAESIQLDVSLAGNIHSSTVGHQRPVRIRSRGLTRFETRKRVFLTDETFLAEPSVAVASTETTIDSIRKTGGFFGRQLVERIAWNKACQSKERAQQIASRRAEKRIMHAFNEQLAEALAAARDRYDRKVHDPLLRRGVLPEHLSMSSRSGYVQIESTFASHGQLGAEGSPPALAAENDLSGRIHQSAANNFLPLMIAGVKIGRESADRPMELSGDMPAWLSKQALAKVPGMSQGGSEADGPETEEGAQDPASQRLAEFQPWSIILSGGQPVSLGFDAGGVSIRIRAALLNSGDKQYRNWDFLVTYDVRPQGNAILLRRRGDIEVFPTGFDPRWDKKMSSSKSGFRTTLARNINARAKRGEGFPAEIEIPAIRLPKELGIPGELVLDQLECDGGWLTLGWKLPSFTNMSKFDD
jgi:hypothetical protein